MSHSSRRIHDLQQVFVRQSVILRDNLHQFDQRLLSGDDWPSMLGRLNAAANQTIYVDQGIEDALDHFAVEPKKCLANPSDVPIFLSVRIVDTEITASSTGENTSEISNIINEQHTGKNDTALRSSIEHVYQYERDAAKFAREFEDNMIRF